MSEKDQDVEMTSAIKKLEGLVNDLFHFRDHYFEINDLSHAEDRQDDVYERFKAVISVFEELEEEGLKEDKATYYYLLGKTYNIGADHEPKAEAMLSKAVKLNPNIVDAWNELGEALFKANKFAASKDCFENAISKERNKVSLRALSYFSRADDGTLEERLKNYTEGVKLAQEAVDLDPTDGVSWTILGNAYMMYFFNGKQSSHFLNSAMEAYQRAEENPVSNYQADMHHNRGMILKYTEDYKKALDAFEMSMKIEPWWNIPSDNFECLLKYLKRCQYSVERKGGIKSKKLLTLINDMHTKYLGRYENEFKVGDSSILLQHVPFSELKVGNNPDKVVLGVVVCTVYNEKDVPFTFGLVDAQGICFVVTVYNLASGAGVLIGDYIAVPTPRLQPINFAYNQTIFDFKTLRVESPQLLLVNGKEFKPQDISNLMALVST